MPEIQDTLTQVSPDSLAITDTAGIQNSLVSTGKAFVTFFEGKSVSYYEGIPIQHTENIWQFSFLLGMLVLIGILRAGFGNRMTTFTRAVLVPRHLRQLMREEGFLFHPFSLLLLFNAVVVYALISYKALKYFTHGNEEYRGLLFFMVILGLILLTIISKILVLRVVEYLTDTDLGQRENRYTWIMFHQFAGLILLPIAGIVLFGKEFWVGPGLFFALVVLIIFLIFRVGKGFLIALGNKVYFLHLFLYLCTLEIIPLIVMIKVLMSQINGFNE